MRFHGQRESSRSHTDWTIHVRGVCSTDRSRPGQGGLPKRPLLLLHTYHRKLNNVQPTPSCKISLDGFQLYSANRAFIQQGTGTSFSYPFPADLIGGGGIYPSQNSRP